MTSNHFHYSFNTSKSPDEIFSILLNPRLWWIGLFNEIIEGKSEIVGDEFSFKAGDGLHFSNQKLIEVIHNQKITWQVTNSQLTFLKSIHEWDGTKICFEIEKMEGNTKITFWHDGLTENLECYGSCSSAWSQYLHNLHIRFNQNA